MEKERTKHDISDVESFHEILPGKEHLKNEMDNDYVTYSHAACEIIKTSIYSIIGLLFQFGVEIINLVFVGHLNDPVFIGGVGLGNIMINVVCFSVGMGMNGAIDTLISQAFGNKQYYLCGVFLNRGRIVQLIFFIPEVIILFFTKDFLEAFGQDEATATAAQSYIFYLIPGMFAMTQFETLRRYLQGMKIFYFTMYVQCITMILHCLWCYLFVFNTNLGLIGASISTCITYFLNLIIGTSIISLRDDIVHPDSWHFFNKDSFRNFYEFLKYGIPATLMLCFEWWCFEILSLLAGMLSVNELAANVVLFNLISFLYQNALGMSFAISNLVGNNIGGLKPNTAKRYFKTSVFIILIFGACSISILNLFKNYVPYIYTQSEEVVPLVTQTIPFFSIMVFFDYTQVVESGSIRAIGYQKYGSIITLFGYWAITMPFAYLFTFTFDLRLKGIWLGIPLGVFVASVCFTIILCNANWKKISDDAYQRIQEEKSELQVSLLEK